MDYRVVVHEVTDYLVKGVTPLVVDQLDRTPKLAPDVFVQELCYRGRCVLP